jgi:polysaccharide biosynthesis/export protein
MSGIIRNYKFLFLLIPLILGSCISNKKLIYIQDSKISKTVPLVIDNQKFQYKIQPKDILNIKILSLDPKTSEFFNVEKSTGGMISPGALYVNGYSVSDSGYVNLPVLGTVKVIDLTLLEARDSIQKIVNEQLQDATVLLKLVNFRITVLGEVRSPGIHYVFNEQVNIFEALGLGSDISEMGNRKKIKLIRQTDQQTSVVYLDITDPEIIKSPYYFLRPNDIIYVENMKLKPLRYNISQLSLAFAAISTSLLLINFFKKK